MKDPVDSLFAAHLHSFWRCVVVTLLWHMSMLVDMDYLHSVIADLHEAGFMDDAARLLLDAVIEY